MPDILSQGGGREPGPWPRRVAAAAVLVLAAVLIAQHLPRSRRPGASRLAIAVLRPQQSPASLVIGQYTS